MNNLEIVRETALSLLNTPYLWGGDSPSRGLDCSGFAMILLKAFGIFNFKEDLTSQQIYDKIKDEKNSFEQPYEGCFIFYGRNKNSITHIMYALNENLCIGAQGGGSNVDNFAKAIALDARVKILPYNYRKDIVSIIDPNY